MNWTPIWALPNIQLDEPVDSDFFALAPASDPRVQVLKREHPEFRKFMLRFTDTFKHRIHPTLILRREDVPERLRSGEAAAGFRDLLVASAIPKARSLGIVHDGGRPRVAYSSFFSVYPWMVDRNYEHIIAHTPAMLAIHEAQAFKGQSSPDLWPVTVNRRDFDEPLLQKLLQRWIDRYNTDKPAWKNLALFRSLNMAYQAMLFPGGPDTTLHDLGRGVVLWVASFETLVHPGGNDEANLRRVFELLGKVRWIDKQCGYRLFETGTKKKRVRRNLACWIYREMNSRRNDFLHGNPIDDSSLIIRQSGRSLFNFAATLYGLGLTSFLDLSWKRQPPPPIEEEEFAQHCIDRMRFNKTQKDAEKALLLARVPLEEQRLRRQQLIAEALRPRRDQ